MTNRLGLLMTCCGLAFSGEAFANVFFGFAPVANGLNTEVEYNAGGAIGPGHISFSDQVTVDLVVDASAFGPNYGVETYEARLSLNLTVGQATASGAPVQGTITFAVGDETILVGTAGPGSGMLVGAPLNTAALIFSNAGGQPFEWEHFGALSDQMNSNAFNEFADGAFALSFVFFTGATNEFGYYESFTANAAFTGTAQYIFPAPGCAGLLAGAACVLGARRRRINSPCH